MAALSDAPSAVTMLQDSPSEGEFGVGSLGCKGGSSSTGVDGCSAPSPYTACKSHVGPLTSQPAGPLSTRPGQPASSGASFAGP